MELQIQNMVGKATQVRLEKIELRDLEEREKMIKELEAQVEAKKNIERLNSAGVGERFKKRNFKNFKITEENKKAYELTIKFIEAFKSKKIEKGLLFKGNVGVGKTHLACAIIHEIIKDGYKVGYGNITDIIGRIYDTYAVDKKEKEAEILKELISYDLLVIDDLGKENGTENSTRILYNLINRLYEECKPVIITTNLSAKELEIKYQSSGKAIVSRITEMTIPVEIKGVDRRLKNEL